jgi:hypothetical protein
MTRCESVTAVDHRVASSDRGIKRITKQAFFERNDFNLRIDCTHALRRGIHLCAANCCRIVGDLSLQIGQIDHIVVRDHDLAHTGASWVERYWGTKSASAHDERARCQQALLPIHTQFVEENVA